MANWKWRRGERLEGRVAFVLVPGAKTVIVGNDKFSMQLKEILSQEI